jgi:hypothetical protein
VESTQEKVMPGTIHVIPRLGKWAVIHEDDQEPLAEFDEHEQAEQAARDHARRHGETKVVVHARGGDVRDIQRPSVSKDVLEEERRQRREH